MIRPAASHLVQGCHVETDRPGPLRWPLLARGGRSVPYIVRGAKRLLARRSRESVPLRTCVRGSKRARSCLPHTCEVLRRTPALNRTTADLPPDVSINALGSINDLEGCPTAEFSHDLPASAGCGTSIQRRTACAYHPDGITDAQIWLYGSARRCRGVCCGRRRPVAPRLHRAIGHDGRRRNVSYPLDVGEPDGLA